MSNDPQMAPAAPAIGVSFSIGIPGERNLVFQTHVAQDADITEMQKVMDKLLRTADRTLAKYAIPALEDAITVEKAQLKRIEDDLTRIDSNREAEQANAQQRGKRLKPEDTEREKQQRAQVVQMVEGYRDKVAKLEAKLVELQEQRDGADVPANR